MEDANVERSLWQRLHGGVILRLIGSCLLVGYMLRRQDFGQDLSQRLGELPHHLGWVVLGLSFAGTTMVLMVWRWSLLLRNLIGQVPFRRLLRFELVSYFFNLTSLGVAGGDAFKIIMLGRDYPDQKIPVGLSVVFDHMVGFVGMVLLSLLGSAALLTHWHSCGGLVQTLIRGYLAFLVGSLVLFVGTIFLASPPALRFLRRRFPTMAKWRIVDALETSYAMVCSTWPVWLRSTLVSMAMTTCFFSTFYCGLRAVGASAPYVDVLVAMPLVDLAASLPLSISGLGMREQTFEAMMTDFSGVARADSVSGAFVGWLFSAAWAVVGGIVFILGRRSP
jgi:glycosyltransferase 2 family protein